MKINAETLVKKITLGGLAFLHLTVQFSIERLNLVKKQL